MWSRHWKPGSIKERMVSMFDEESLAHLDRKYFNIILADNQMDIISMEEPGR